MNRLADELRQEADVLILIEVEPGEQRRQERRHVGRGLRFDDEGSSISSIAEYE